MHDVVKAVIYRKDHFLLQLRDNDPAVSYPNTWSFFGCWFTSEEIAGLSNTPDGIESIIKKATCHLSRS
jgi:hypothetical protein